MYTLMVALILVFAMLTTACGGLSSSSSTQQLTDEHNESLPGINPVDFSSPVRTLRWPTDFPTTIQAGLSPEIYVTGLATNSAYDFDVTLAENFNDDPTLFVVNYAEDNPSGTSVCFGDPDCTGTVIDNRLWINLVGFQSGTATLEITRSDTRPLVNQGTPEQPVLISVDSSSVTHEGSTASSSQPDPLDGISYYRLTDLVVGDRYRVTLQTDEPWTELHYGYVDNTESACDPNYPLSDPTLCYFVADSTTQDIAVMSWLTGDLFSIVVEHDESENSFEGGWRQPVMLNVPNVDDPVQNLVRHVGIADIHGSSYLATNLNPQKKYRILVSGKNEQARLSLVAADTGLRQSYPASTAIYGLSPLYRRLSDDQLFIENASEAAFSVMADDATSRFIATVQEVLDDQGTADLPIILGVNESGNLHFTATVRENSYYLLDGFIPGQSYDLQLNTVTERPNFTLTSDESSTDVCRWSWSFCAFTADTSSMHLDTTGIESATGTEFSVSIKPNTETATADIVTPENVTLDATSLPYAGAATYEHSRYTIEDLIPDELYVVEVSSSDFLMKISPSLNSTSSTCSKVDSYFTDVEPSSTLVRCLTRARADGTTELWAKTGNPGNQPLTLVSIERFINSSSDFKSVDTPLVIPANEQRAGSEIEVYSEIFVDTASLAGFPEVTILADHTNQWRMRATLETPDGQRILLSKDLSRDFIQYTRYSDLSQNPYPYPSSVQYRRVYRPVTPLHILRGINPSGVWRLHLYYRYADEPGNLISWGLSF